MKQSKLFNYLICAGLFFALNVDPTPVVPGQNINNKNYIHLQAVDNPIQDGLSTRLFFPSSPKEQFTKQLK
ncbi:hypothetical protein D3C87_818320 [compost metagenome]|uniref:hypothetical protein n=1 Tax=Sphingobacterium sp. BIGb0165 TaxID=2940615 RepID=UPI000FAE6E05|nr:hypothetical protein [Sphingobacterium sp. BIGb0165]MCS4227963.1 hypothetical protein [Sphingobacterium sp. BIGb0165]